jgi:hypothetical protein
LKLCASSNTSFAESKPRFKDIKTKKGYDMILRRHHGVDVNGRPIYSLEIPEPLVQRLDLKPEYRPDWLTLDLEGPLAIFVLCDFHAYKEGQLEPLAAWICGLGAKYVRTWGGNKWEGGYGYDVSLSELARAVEWYDTKRRLDYMARLWEGGAGDAEAGEAALAEYGTEVATSYEGEVELDAALETFLSSLEFWDGRVTPYSVLVATIGNREWAAKVQQRLDDDEWIPKALGLE